MKAPGALFSSTDTSYTGLLKWGALSFSSVSRMVYWRILRNGGEPKSSAITVRLYSPMRSRSRAAAVTIM